MISRRLFVAGSAGVMALRARRPRVSESKPAILDLEAGCGLPESIRGFHAAMKSAEVVRRVRRNTDLIIVPGAMALAAQTVDQIHSAADMGSTIILETAIAFGNAREFAGQRRILSREFGIEIESPIDLWRGAVGSGLPYIEYKRPLVFVRDFGHAVPVVATGDQALAAVQNFTVAASVPFGPGKIIFLGSPLGPVLLAGDREGAHWLSSQALQALVD